MAFQVTKYHQSERELKLSDGNKQLNNRIMKLLLQILPIIFMYSWGLSQTCTVTVTGPTPAQVCPGGLVTISASGTIIGANQSFNFNNNTLPSGWSTSGTANYGTLCGNSLDNTPYFWASTATGTPNITTAAFDVCSGGNIVFDLRYAIQGGSSPCEGPDEQDEGVSIQYSTDGGATWIDIIYYSPWGFTLPSNPGGNSSISGATPYTSWGTYTVPIPPGAISTNTMFRWIQFSSSGSCCDNWGLDNIYINAGPCLTTNIGWDVSGSNTPSTNSITVPIYSDTVIVAGLYDNSGNFMCQSTPISVTVFTPHINGGPDQTICQGSSITLSGTNGSGFVWDNGVTDGVAFAPSTTATYNVSGTDLNGCPATDQVLVTVIPSNVYSFSYPNNAYCIDAADPSPAISDNSVSGSYSISPATVSINATSGVIDLSTSTTANTQLYTVTYTPTTACYQPVTTQLTINALPIVNAGADLTICYGVPETFTATGNANSYTWNNGVGANGSSVTPPMGTTTYTATGTSAAGCVNSDTKVVTVNPLPLASISGSTNVCLNATQPSITFTGSNSTAAYTFSYSLNGGAIQQIVSDASGVASISIPTGTSGSFQYDLISVTDASASTCSNLQTGTATVVVNALPTGSIIGSTIVCQNSSQPEVTFTGAGTVSPYTFTYTLNGMQHTVTTALGVNSAIVALPTSNVGNFDFELLSVQDASTIMCSQALSGIVNITVNPLPNATITGDIALCLNENQPNVTFTGNNATAPYTFTYSMNGGTPQTISGSNQAMISVPTSIDGTFVYELISVQESSLAACSSAVGQQVTVTVWPLPEVTAVADYSICDGVSTTLNAQGAVTYNWDNNVVDGVAFTPSITTTYTVVGIDNNGCTNSDQVVVTVIPIPEVNFTASLVADCSPLITTLTNNSTGNLTNCQWILSDGTQLTGCGSVDVTIENPGCYDVTLYVSTPEGCANSTTVPSFLCVYQNPVAVFNATPIQATTANSFVNFFNSSIGADFYHWDFEDGTTSAVENPYHEFPGVEQADYNVMMIASTNYGCIDTAYLTIEILEDLIYYVPNTFSPDGDEFNNVFFPVLTSGFDVNSYNLMIFNRWGELIFESFDYQQGWDGTYHGVIQKEGVYSWKIKVKRKYSDKKVELFGHVNLLK